MLLFYFGDFALVFCLFVCFSSGTALLLACFMDHHLSIYKIPEVEQLSVEPTFRTKKRNSFQIFHFHQEVLWFLPLWVLGYQSSQGAVLTTDKR